jgi:hypothetical protein
VDACEDHRQKDERSEKYERAAPRVPAAAPGGGRVPLLIGPSPARQCGALGRTRRAGTGALHEQLIERRLEFAVASQFRHGVK